MEAKGTKLESLQRDVVAHAGEFLCQRIDTPKQTKAVAFRHRLTPPDDGADVPDLRRLRDFYATFGSLTFYEDPVSGDAAVHLAHPGDWPQLDADCQRWFDDLDEDERGDLPDWFDGTLVIGEEPHTGNYLLMPTRGECAGRVYSFDHDGYGFTQEASDIVEFVGKMLAPDNRRLTVMASHMRFIDGNPMIQWWIVEMRDNRGHVARTQA